jgi:hypothetical protein
LRGGRSGPNYESEYVIKALDLIEGAGLLRRVMVDASHGNSGKDHRRQAVTASAVADQVAEGQHGLAGIMLESFLRDGRQEPGDPAGMVYGRSVTDSCMDIGVTADVLGILAGAARQRRGLQGRDGRWTSSGARKRATGITGSTQGQGSGLLPSLDTSRHQNGSFALASGCSA